MLRFAAISLALVILALILIILGNLLSVAVVVIAKIALWIFVPIFIICLVSDFIRRRKTRKS